MQEMTKIRSPENTHNRYGHLNYNTTDTACSVINQLNNSEKYNFTPISHYTQKSSPGIVYTFTFSKKENS